MSGGKVVCVTGASGCTASWLIKFLLQSGYTVNATVRDPNDPTKTAHLLELDGASERLGFFKADLMEEGSFDAAVHGCEGVFHTACPVSLSPIDPQTELIDPAVRGTLNVLTSCAKVHTIRRVILTSSFVTVPYDGKPIPPETVFDETWFSDPDVCKERKLWFQLAKTLAEQAAWKFAEDNRIDLVTINPGLVLGPLLHSTCSYSVGIILKIINGAKEYPDAYFKPVDVRDVANAHIKAFEISSASGRYCLVERESHCSEVLEIVHQHYPTLDLPQKCIPGMSFLVKYGVSKERANTLGIDFIPLDVTLKDTIESLEEKGFITI
ncbi:phenylacetaldehyde reductase-like isoform X2 [Mercurialis annua]|uniref:phenylacetaldehyde reductase-like isoform X2 n=1 Tax=Mercurialis annua TaxID=3986 RepID=UPI00215EA3DF|nr:phenylacetaldehyde reductase-like isoform X2 [Mercurialis annua]XP_050209181.1 phenylacetaldehyde reductase-like isoform X2 [Mercurialis annua]XP_050209182.1 phenylacetaldehyde reductase-like isoform X2 [Mercurialis annua]XP_050209183.1 phenylacetaldehyde reductase-like isoform X2 [Mercurialis annua]